MNYNALIQQLKQATLFELWRFRCVIDQLLENPDKIKAIQRVLKPGMHVSYFDDGENRLISAVIINVKNTRALVLNKETNQSWNLPFHMLKM